MSLIPFTPTYPPATPCLDATPPLPADHAIGLRHFHATDPARDDESTAKRQFMVSVFYPAKPNDATPRARLTDIFAPKVDEVLAVLAQGASGKKAEKEAAIARLQSLTLRAQRELEPAGAEARPVLIYYPGGLCHRLSNAALCEQFAAAGYIVVALDAPRDAPAVVFPDGTLVPCVPNSNEDYIWPRVADVRFLLDHLESLNGLAGTLDTSRIGMFGHSRGGYLSNICAVEDARIKAAVNMDGFLWGLWTEGTGLAKYPPEFQARARALRTPILRLRGDQGGAEGAKRGFDAEVQDFGGDFTYIAFDGAHHGDFSAKWMNGQAKDFAPNTAAEPDFQRTGTLHDLLDEFFDTYLLRQQTRMPLLATRPEGMHILARETAR